MLSKIKVSVIVTNDQGQVLLLKEKVKKNQEPLWNIIKGTYGDNGSETIFEAAKRECREEASIEVELIGSTGCYVAGDVDNYAIQFNFCGKILKGEARIALIDEQKSRDENISEVKWFDIAELRKLSKDEFISEKIYLIVQDWLKEENYPLSIIKQ